MERNSGGVRGIMTRSSCRVRRLAIALVLGMAGCKGLVGSQGLPHDPMFLDKQPIAAKPRNTPPVALAFAEPTPPVNPYLVQQPPLLAAPPRPVPATLTNRPRTDSSPEERDER
jgi:hypothetical protein